MDIEGSMSQSMKYEVGGFLRIPNEWLKYGALKGMGKEMEIKIKKC